MLAVQDTAADMKSLLSQNTWSFPVAMADNQIAAAYGIRAVPTVVVLDSLGHSKKTLVGGDSADKLIALVNDLTK